MARVRRGESYHFRHAITAVRRDTVPGLVGVEPTCPCRLLPEGRAHTNPLTPPAPSASRPADTTRPRTIAARPALMGHSVRAFDALPVNDD